MYIYFFDRKFAYVEFYRIYLWNVYITLLVKAAERFEARSFYRAPAKALWHKRALRCARRGDNPKGFPFASSRVTAIVSTTWAYDIESSVRSKRTARRMLSPLLYLHA